MAILLTLDILFEFILPEYSRPENGNFQKKSR